MRFYVATGLGNAAAHNRLRDALMAMGHEISYDWTSHGSMQSASVEKKAEIAQHETRGVLEADFVALLLPGGRGTHAELGMALAVGVKVFIHVPEGVSEFDETGKHCIFHYHPLVQFVRGDLLTLVTTISSWTRGVGDWASYSEDRRWFRNHLLERFHPEPLSSSGSSEDRREPG